MSTINCKGKLVDLSVPKIMGIVNLTPDSFYDGGSLKNNNDVLRKVDQMLNDGADFIDVGGYSSRPGASFVEIEEELQRVLPIVELLIRNFPDIILSIDTFRSEIAENAIKTGASMINDISAGKLDTNMLQTIGRLKVPYIMMHMKGNPQTMTSLTQYDDLIKEIIFYFSERIAEARKFGIDDIIIDPGFGFSKDINQNFELLKNLELLQILELPVLAGVSRKSMIYKTLNTSSEMALNGTTFLHSYCLQKQARILRVHDVKEAVESVKLYTKLI